MRKVRERRRNWSTTRLVFGLARFGVGHGCELGWSIDAVTVATLNDTVLFVFGPRVLIHERLRVGAEGERICMLA